MADIVKQWYLFLYFVSVVNMESCSEGFYGIDRCRRKGIRVNLDAFFEGSHGYALHRCDDDQLQKELKNRKLVIGCPDGFFGHAGVLGISC